MDEEDFLFQLDQRLDATDVCDILELTVKDLWEAFYERIIDNEELRHIARYEP